MKRFSIIILLLLSGCGGSGANQVVTFPTEKHRLIAFGDSWTAEGTYPRLIGAENYGKGGDTTYLASKRLDALQLNEGDVVVALFGVNDFAGYGYDIETFLHYYAIIIDHVKTYKAKIIIASIPAIRSTVFSEESSALFDFASKQSSDGSVAYCSTGFLFKPELYANDTHPNEEGYKILAQRIRECLK